MRGCESGGTGPGRGCGAWEQEVSVLGVIIIWVGYQQWGVWVEGIWDSRQGPGGPRAGYSVSQGSRWTLLCVVLVLLGDGAG